MERGSRTPWISSSLLLPLVCVTLSWGCQMAGMRYRPSPLSSQEQRQQVEKIAPPGTPRVDVERRLQQAGIEITPGASDRIAYCDIWNRSGGERWVMNVALLFDESGKLEGTRPSQAETGVLAEQEPSNPSSMTTTSVSSAPQSGSFDSTTADAPASSFTTELPSTGVSQASQERRTPFETPKPAYAP